MENLKQIQLAAFETESRSYEHSTLEVLNYTPKKGSRVLLTAQGTATLFLSKKGDKFIKEINQFVKSKNGDEQTIADKFKKQFEGLKELSLEEARIYHSKSAVISSLKYGNKTLVDSIFIPDNIKVLGVSFPYNGGQLENKNFQLFQYLKDATKQRIEGFIVIHEPKLTKAEADILKQLPANQFELNIGTNPVGFATALIAIAAAVSLATGICCPQINENFVIPNYAYDPYDVHLPDNVIQQISVTAAASEILKIRRDFLIHKF